MILNLLLFSYRYLISPCIHLIAGAGFGCRFFPTCSEYSAEAFRKHGLWKGAWLSIRRLSRCHPFASSGFDPVPCDRGSKSLWTVEHF